MHFLFYSPTSLPSVGGLQFVVHYWATELVARGHTVTLLTNTPGPARNEAAWGYRVLRQKGWYENLEAMRQADLILMFNVSLRGLPLCILSGKRIVLSHHTALWYDKGPRPWQQYLKRWAANHLVKQQVACSAYIARSFKNCPVVFSPYRSDVFTTDTVARLPRQLFFAARLVSDKAADLLLHAVAKLQWQSFDVQLTLVGDGPEKAALTKQINDLGLQDRVTMKGSLTQRAMVQQMQKHALMVVPSRMEPMGMVVAEGLACGCTMVVARQGGMPEVGSTFCHYFEPNNVEDLVRALKEAMQHPIAPNPTDLAQHLSQFTIRHSVDKLLEVIG